MNFSALVLRGTLTIGLLVSLNLVIFQEYMFFDPFFYGFIH